MARAWNSVFMDSRQLIRKETKMDVVHLNQKQLATRWCIRQGASSIPIYGVKPASEVPVSGLTPE